MLIAQMQYPMSNEKEIKDNSRLFQSEYVHKYKLYVPETTTTLTLDQLSQLNKLLYREKSEKIIIEIYSKSMELMQIIKNYLQVNRQFI